MSNNLNRSFIQRLAGPVLIGPLLLISGCNETTAAKTRPSTTAPQQANPQLQLLTRVNTLEDELAKLRNTVEVQQNEITRLQERLSALLPRPGVTHSQSAS